jgi:hypothetical protein
MEWSGVMADKECIKAIEISIAFMVLYGAL